MRIPETIIEKYKLVNNGIQSGNSFINNLIIYSSKLPYTEPVLFMECDFSGEATDMIIVYNKVTKRYIKATPEYLADTNFEMIVAQLKDPKR